MVKDSEQSDSKPQGSASSKPKPADEPRLGASNASSTNGGKENDDDKFTPSPQPRGARSTTQGVRSAKPVEDEDYLKPFEIHQATGRPYFELSGVSYSSPTPGSKRAKMKAILLKQPRIRFFVPRKDGEDKTVHQQVCLNGYRLEIPKNTYIDVPQQIAEVLADSLSQTEAALNQFLIDKKEGVGNALT